MPELPEYELCSLERNRLAFVAGCAAKELFFMLTSSKNDDEFQSRLEAIVGAFSESFADLMIDFAMDNMNEDYEPDESDDDFLNN